jgi:hypothetical protein
MLDGISHGKYLIRSTSTLTVIWKSISTALTSKKLRRLPSRKFMILLKLPKWSPRIRGMMKQNSMCSSYSVPVTTSPLGTLPLTSQILILKMNNMLTPATRKAPAVHLVTLASLKATTQRMATKNKETHNAEELKARIRFLI